MLHTKYQGSWPFGFIKTSHFPYTSLFKTTPGADPFLAPQVLFELTYWGSTRWCNIPNIKALRPVVSDKIFSRFPCISLCKTFDPRGWAIFGPRGIIWTNLVEVHWVMLHTKYQGYRPSGFRPRFFLIFSHLWPRYVMDQNHFRKGSP